MNSEKEKMADEIKAELAIIRKDTKVMLETINQVESNISHCINIVKKLQDLSNDLSFKEM